MEGIMSRFFAIGGVSAGWSELGEAAIIISLCYEIRVPAIG